MNNDALLKFQLSEDVVGQQSRQEANYLAFCLTFMVEPLHVLETGTGMANVAVNILRALGRRDKGTLWTVESDPLLAEFANAALVQMREYSPDMHFDPRLIATKNLSFEPPDDVTFDLCWFDTGDHVDEFDHFRRWMRVGTIVVFVNPPSVDLSLDIPEIREVRLAAENIHIAEVIK